MNLQVKVLVPILTVLILSFALLAVIENNSMVKTEEKVLAKLDESNIALANTLAFLIAEDEENLTTERMITFANLFGVDEVHVTDENGILLWGNVPGFFEFDFAETDQTRPLLAILNNSSLAIAQEPQPRGTDGVMFQYISVSRIDGRGIVQVGVNMSTMEEIHDFGTKSIINTVIFGVVASLIISVIMIVVIRWIVRKLYWHEQILDSISFPISVTDNNMKWTFINKAVEDFLGKKRKHVMGQPCSNWGAGICNTHTCGVRCLERGETGTRFTQNGLDFKVDVSYLTDSHNNRIGHIELVQDITQVVATQKSEEKLIKKIREISHSFTDSVQQVSHGAQSFAQSSTEQSAVIQELSDSITEITEKTKRNAQMAERAAGLTRSVKSSAEKGNVQMDAMTTAVEEINESSQQIGKVIKTIDDIAFQTNILALNAAVEAARAGQAGKGFAVVAEEVRNLASKSAEAAKDTASLIENSMNKAQLGTQIADETASSLREIVESVNESNQLIGEIANLSDEQSQSIEQIKLGIEQVTDAVQQNSATAEESAAASQEMGHQANSLERLIVESMKSLNKEI
ncbi:MAG: methyl-accepting chemotaxis protein [Oscillospiraceae bacterium]|nr:methyl-accepting chemotaxis protein [Oscillospiraceae bacterium]